MGRGTAPKKLEAIVELKESRKLVRILIVDDDEDFLLRTRLFFEINDFVEVVTSDSLDQALNELENVKTKENPFHVIIMDYDFDDSDVSGGEFIFENIEILGNSRVFIVTSVDRDDELQNTIEILKKSVTNKAREKIALIDKHTGEWREKTTSLLYKEAERKFIEDINERVGNLGSAKVATKKQKQETKLDKSVDTIFLQWLKSVSDEHAPAFLIGNHSYTADELMQQIENETDDGLEVLEMFRSEIISSLNITIPDEKKP